MVRPDDIELHDAVVERLEVDYPARAARIAVSYYASHDARQRSRAVIRFEQVESVSHHADLLAMVNNASAGNVNYWNPAVRAKRTFIYLVEGCLAVEAELVFFEPLNG